MAETMASGAVAGSIQTRLSAAPSLRSSAIRVVTSATLATPLEAPCAARATASACARTPSACRSWAPARSRGSPARWARRGPRMLNSQLIDSGSVSTTTSAFSAASVLRSSSSLSLAVRPARLSPRNSTGLTGGFGRSVQIWSTRLAEGTRVTRPASFSPRSLISPGVCSQGSKPSLPPLGMKSPIRASTPPCAVSMIVTRLVSVSIGACSV